jgi:hypothetical protein
MEFEFWSRKQKIFGQENKKFLARKKWRKINRTQIEENSLGLSEQKFE